MSDTFSLATRLRALDDETLAREIRAREVRAGSIKDFFDLAEAFLDRQSIQVQLTRLDRMTLAVAAAASAATPSRAVTVDDVVAILREKGSETDVSAVESRLRALVALLLADSDTADEADTSNTAGSDGANSPTFAATVYDSVAEQLRSWPAFGLPGLDELASAVPGGVMEPVADVDIRFIDRVASERAFAATSEITEMLAELEREPARELAKGGVALPDSKRLANAMAVALESVPRLLTIAFDADLVAREGGFVLITEAGGAWLQLATGTRWGALVDGWRRRLPPDILAVLRERDHAAWGSGFARYIDWLYPAGGSWMADRIEVYTTAAELLGITANQAPSSPGSLLLASGADAAAPAMTELLPREVEQVYLQHDLSIVAPGPLTPEVDGRLRSIADVESRALASSYRVTAATMNRAMAAGETAESVREFLSAISLTGIPQPLDYLITEASARYGLLRVGSISESDAGDSGARSYVRSDDEAMLGTVLVDQNLSALGFTRIDGGRAHSRFALDTVFWSLSDARYPVAAEDAAGEVVSVRRRRHARPAPPATADSVAGLLERLRLGSDDEPDEASEAWLSRQLETAIRVKAALTVSVTMPNGSIVDYQLEPTSIAGGRLRARDRRSAIERTLPLSSIAGISTADDA
ncbi:helicase-associated domain-containing protein [Marisediminicola sp. LYQ85]|uniref:helicase-associated domain-containing protein n=1 Tax=Marisediminicola sp. LYQ85 TaxID=3391062 RepID=UPI00398394B9